MGFLYQQYEYQYEYEYLYLYANNISRQYIEIYTRIYSIDWFTRIAHMLKPRNEASISSKTQPRPSPPPIPSLIVHARNGSIDGAIEHPQPLAAQPTDRHDRQRRRRLLVGREGGGGGLAVIHGTNGSDQWASWAVAHRGGGGVRLACSAAASATTRIATRSHSLVSSKAF